ncbi:MAG: hypothetical protein AAGD38_14225 [Acidobacteriota bacterium]
MSEDQTGSGKQRPSKARLRHQTFHDTHGLPMRPRAGASDVEAAEVPSRLDYLGAMRAYRERQREASQRETQIANRWTPIGPSAVLKGQAVNRPVMSGRVSSIAITEGGERIYVGAANGGVWRSEDGGDSWVSLMEAFDLDPVRRGSDSLAVGALAVVTGATANDDVIYVGSGEAIDGGADPTSGPMFGVGPVVSFDGGQNWVTEPGAPGGPWSVLAGHGFYELAVDPIDPTRVLAATRTGLFKREPSSNPNLYRWRHISLPGFSPSTSVTSVVVAQQDGVGSVYYAAPMNGPVFRSEDGGEMWEEVGTDLSASPGRMRLAVAADSADIVYAFDAMFWLRRLDIGEGRWRAVDQLQTQFVGLSMPHVSSINARWNLAVAVEPGNPNRVYLGGGASGVDENGWLNTQIVNFSACLFRCDVTASTTANGAISISNTLHYIGAAVHPDVHAIVFPPGDASEMWVGCDGGVFVTDHPPGEDGGLLPPVNSTPAPRFYFEAKNTGLQTLTLHHIGQHPTEEAVLFCGTQDHGVLRYTGDAAWLHPQSGDCGYVVVHWNNPYRVLASLQPQVIQSVRRALIVRSTEGGNLDTFETLTNRPAGISSQALFYYPMAGTPSGSGSPGLVAVGATQVWITENFGSDWRTVPNDDLAQDTLVGPVRAIEFASEHRFYVGTHSDGSDFTDMAVYRFDRNGGAYSVARIDLPIFPFSAGLPFDGSVSDIAMDWSDPTGASIYVSFGGFGVFGHVWHYDGNLWERRDGGSPGQPGSLLDISHNAIVVDPEHPQVVYVAADIGIWRSADSGATWHPFSRGLPDAAVIDLKIHPRRLLRASTHGRGVFEYRLDADSIAEIELYIRDTILDQGRRETEDGLDDPLDRQGQVWHWNGPDIKIDFPTANGDYQFVAGRQLDFVEYSDLLQDDAAEVGSPPGPGAHRVYAQIHNRGLATANNVRVVALITHATVSHPPLPNDYEERVRQGSTISNDDWETIDIKTVHGVTARLPQVVPFDIPPELLPPAGPHGRFAYSVLILVHHAEDEHPLSPVQQFGNVVVRMLDPVDVMCRRRRLAAIKTPVQPFTASRSGGLRPEGPFMFPFTVAGSLYRVVRGQLRFRIGKGPYSIRIFQPPLELSDDWKTGTLGFERGPAEALDGLRFWIELYEKSLDTDLSAKAPPHRGWAKQRLTALHELAESKNVLEARGVEQAVLSGIELGEKDLLTFVLQIVPTEKWHDKDMRDKGEIGEVEIFFERAGKEKKYEVAGGQRVVLMR